MLLPDNTFEEHYSIKDLSKPWKVSVETIRLLIKDEPGVIRIQLGKKKTMCRYSVPATVARRIHTSLTAPARAKRGILGVAYLVLVLNLISTTLFGWGVSAKASFHTLSKTLLSGWNPGGVVLQHHLLGVAQQFGHILTLTPGRSSRIRANVWRKRCGVGLSFHVTAHLPKLFSLRRQTSVITFMSLVSCSPKMNGPNL